MRFLAIVIAFVILGSVVAGCTSATTTEAPTVEEVAAPPGASTIEEVYAKIGCKLDDALGTRGRVEGSEAPELERTGMCTPLRDAELVFFYEAESETALDAFIASGRLEVGATDALYRDGSVLMLVTDAATAKVFGEQFETVD